MSVAESFAARPGDEALADAIAAAAATVAGAFAAGGSLWAVAPGATHHARHIAVEFVHPVIVGTRSLPATAVEDPVDLLGALRLSVRPGDVVVGVGAGDDPVLVDVMRRGRPWGTDTVLLCWGTAPPPGVADHVARLPENEADAVMAYHLLWELTQVVLEHGIVPTDQDGRAGTTGTAGTADDVCITCSDEARLVEVVSVLDEATAIVLAEGRREQVDTSIVAAVAPGDLLLVHAGLAVGAPLDPVPGPTS
ncbi:MAG: HypC/HybG/HupF family hydrogenase formation chaperone [Actinomycetota bacterium]|nr:HypC/HybG/HupF family hydrogenase formation chaperone [Actinomycetota bacterium]